MKKLVVLMVFSIFVNGAAFAKMDPASEAKCKDLIAKAMKKNSGGSNSSDADSKKATGEDAK